MCNPGSLLKSIISLCFYYYNPPRQFEKVARQTPSCAGLPWQRAQHAKRHAGPSLWLQSSVCCGLTQHSRGPRGLCCFCMLLESPSTPAHGQIIQMNSKWHHTAYNTTAKHNSTFRGMTNAPSTSVNKSESSLDYCSHTDLLQWQHRYMWY